MSLGPYPVEHVEGSLQLLLREQVLLVDGGHHELGVVDLSALVGVDPVEHLLDLVLGHAPAHVLLPPVQDLLLRQTPVAVGVEGLEYLLQVVLFRLVEQLARDEAQRGLLQLLLRLGRSCSHLTLKFLRFLSVLMVTAFDTCSGSDILRIQGCVRQSSAVILFS